MNNHTEVAVEERAQQEVVSEIAFAALVTHGRLDPSAVRFLATPITRGDEFCGWHFALYGPRDVLLTAVWDATASVLWCYDSRGERFDAPAVGEGETKNS